MLNFANTQVKRLPENLSDIETDVNLNDSQIEELPPVLTIQGNLIIGNAPIKKLPENLIITGDLDLTNSEIKNIPNTIFIGGNVIGNDVSYTPLNLYNGRITSKAIMWENIVMPYRKVITMIQRVSRDNEKTDTALIYYGLSKDDKKIIVYKNKWFYLAKKYENIDWISKDIEFKKTKERINEKYLSLLKENRLLTFKEILPIYQDLSNACEDITERFLKYMDKINMPEDKKLPLSEWIEMSRLADKQYEYNYLFWSYFDWLKESE